MTIWVNVAPGLFADIANPREFYFSKGFETEEEAIAAKSKGKAKFRSKPYIATVPVQIPTKVFLEYINKYKKK